MSKIGVRLKINCSQIEKARLFQGKQGAYLDATVFIDLDNKDQYNNNGMITQDVTKEENQNGVKGNILGNCSIFWSDSQQTTAQKQGGFNQAPVQQGGFNQPQPLPTMAQQEAQQQGGFGKDIPF